MVWLSLSACLGAGSVAAEDAGMSTFPLPADQLPQSTPAVQLWLSPLRIGDVLVKEDRPETRGMVSTVSHLGTVEEVD